MQNLSFTVTCSFTYSDMCTDSKLDYCCSVLAGVSGTLQRRLQSVFNAAARLVFSASKSEHVTPLLQELHWLKVPERIQIAATSGDTAPMCDTIAAKLYPSVGTQHWRQKNCKLGVLSRKYWAIDILMQSWWNQYSHPSYWMLSCPMVHSNMQTLHRYATLARFFSTWHDLNWLGDLGLPIITTYCNLCYVHQCPKQKPLSLYHMLIYTVTSVRW